MGKEGGGGVTHSWPNAMSNRFQLSSCALSTLQRGHGGRQERKERWREERKSVPVCVCVCVNTEEEEG